jgi:hypothetical protein
MKTTILIAHYKVGKITAYAISQLLKYKGNHEIDIVVVDNNPDDGSAFYIYPFLKDITIVNYPKDRMQSQGAAYDWVLPSIRTETFLTMESDAWPTKIDFLDYYEQKINEGFDCIGSLQKLSGGTYFHPCGTMYRTNVWQEAKEYFDNVEYEYFPNMSRSNGFDCHLMVHESILDAFMKNPDDYIELAEGYKPYTPLKALEKMEYYRPAKMVFHSGLGGRQENVKTYGYRTMETEVPHIILNHKNYKYINRIGYEPGQAFSYWLAATNKKIFNMPIEIKWMDGQEGKQQEYTLNEAGIYHAWGISSYGGSESTDKVATYKKSIPDQLYETLPDHQKIKS